MAEPLQTLDQAIKLHKAGQLKKAKQLYMNILSEHPNQAEANHMLGVIAYQEHEFEESVKLISKAIEIEAENPTFHVSLGLAYEEMGNINKAENSFQKALLISGKSSSKKPKIAKEEAFFIRDILATLTKVSQTYSQNSSEETEPIESIWQINLHLAQLYFAKADYKQALKQFLELHNATMPEETLAEVYLKIALCLFINQEFEQANKLIHKSLEISKSEKTIQETRLFLQNNNLAQFLFQIDAIEAQYF